MNQKKFKLKPEMSIRKQEFARGIEALFKFSQQKQAQAKLERYDEDLRQTVGEMFAKAGGRNGVLSIGNFIE